MTSESPGWYYAESDPLGTKRYWYGFKWSKEVMGGNIIWPRFLAKLIDSFIVGVALVIVAAGIFDTTKITYTILLVSIFLSALYEIGFVTLKGATPGKILLGFKIVQISDGKSPPLGSTASSRFVPNVVSLVPLIGWFLNFAIVGISLYWLTVDPDRQSIFDRAGKTYVVRAVG